MLFNRVLKHIVIPLCVNFSIGFIKMYLQFVSFLHNDMTQVGETLPHVKQELTT